MTTNAIGEKLRKVFEDHPEIEGKLKDMDSVEEFRALLADYQVDVTDEEVDTLLMQALQGSESEELSEEQLENVAGGLSWKGVGIAWRIGARIGMGIRMIYDYHTTGNAYKNYTLKNLATGRIF